MESPTVSQALVLVDPLNDFLSEGESSGPTLAPRPRPRRCAMADLAALLNQRATGRSKRPRALGAVLESRFSE